MEEIWKDIKGYEGSYQVSNLGRVKSLQRKVWNGHAWHDLPEKILKERKAVYLRVSLCNENRIVKDQYIHRLVAQNFIDNPNDKPTVNHKDGNKHNNDVSNLEWCTYAENQKHACVTLGRKSNKGQTWKHNRNTKRYTV